jgi:hypothetical protein
MDSLRRWQADRARALRSDEGLSLAEMIITIGLTALVGAFTFSLLIQGVRSTGSTAIRQDNAGQARIAIEAMSKNLRAAAKLSMFQTGTCTAGCDPTAVTAAAADSVTLYANVRADDSAPVRVTYAVVGNTLVERMQQPVFEAGTPKYSFCTPGDAGCAVTTRTLVRGLVTPTAAEPLFRFYRDDGTEQTVSTPATETELGNIDSVDILAKVRTSSKWNTPAMSVMLRVALPNADYTRPAPTGGS